MLDLSIPQLTPEIFEEIKGKRWRVREKYDGVKVSILRLNTPYHRDYTKNWVVSYKGNIIYPTEFENLNLERCLNESIGLSQFWVIHDWLRIVHKRYTQVHSGAEFHFEFIMQKPTLTRDYTNLDIPKLVYLGFSRTTYEIKNGTVKTTPEHTDLYHGMSQHLVTPDAFDPHLFFEGKLEDYALTFEEFRKQILSQPSSFGGKTEGVVIDNGKTFYKLLQDDQHDDKTRNDKKNRYRMDKTDESDYWKLIHRVSNEISDRHYQHNIQNSLYYISKEIYGLKTIPIRHTKKTLMNIKDDLMLTAKTALIKKQPGNNGAVFIGRFQPPTKAHVEIVRDMMRDYDTVTLNIVSTGYPDEYSPIPVEIVKNMWNEVFPELNIQVTKTGNISTIINKAENNINVIVAGTDRVGSYEKQLTRHPFLRVHLIERTESDVSSTKVRKALHYGDFDEFKNLMNELHWGFFDELRSHIV